MECEFPVIEYERRLESLRRLMREKGMQAVLLGTGANLRYFTGYPSPSCSVPRPFFVLLPISGEPVFFTHTGHQAEAAKYSWISDVRTYSELSRAPVDLIRQAFSDKSLLPATIGMELGSEQTLDISHLEFRRLQRGLASTVICDAADILWRLRMIKTPAEVEALRHACRLTGEAYSSTFRRARQGMTELDIFRMMHQKLSLSMGDTFLAITSGAGNYDLVTKPPEQRALQQGDFVWMDAGCTVRGYWSDFSRAAVVGQPSAEQNFAQEAIHAITWEAARMIRPGVKASSVALFCAKELAELTLPVTSSITALAARVGHGLGLNMTEPPHVSISDHTHFESGMAITIEPGIATSYGTFHVEENILVTEDGYELLSNSPRDLQPLAS